MANGRVCAVWAFDSARFGQGQASIQRLLEHKGQHAVEPAVLALGLSAAEREWCDDRGVTVSDLASQVPNFAGTPESARAQTFRPYVRELLPGYDIYLCVDAHVRVVWPDALDMYLGAAAAHPQLIAVAHEVDPTYAFVMHPAISRNYHAPKRARMLEVYGSQMAEQLDGFLCFNSGLFALHRDSVIWEAYRQNLERAMQTPYDHMKEQDALNMAIWQTGMQVYALSAIYNWLCSVSVPILAPDSRRWVRPAPPHVELSVLHFTNPSAQLQVDGQTMSLYEYYCALGMENV